jgi:hypothetical protein
MDTMKNSAADTGIENNRTLDNKRQNETARAYRGSYSDTLKSFFGVSGIKPAKRRPDQYSAA